VRSGPTPWLVLLRAPGLGPVSAGRLLERFGDPERVLGASRRELRDAGLTQECVAWLTEPDRSLLDRDLAWLDAEGHHLVSILDPRYPRLLQGIADPPVALFVAGDPAILGRPALAVVGSRNPTAGGARNAADLARFLARAGLVIVSGLAVGIDTAAHAGALGEGVTVAVLGTGPDHIYPAASRGLAREILGRGALVSEFPPGVPVRREHFPRRNRIISGMSVGTLVVEAGTRSGSLITARYAADQGREVFAIPGSIHNPLARGCHALIREGAKLVEQGADVLEELGPLLATTLADAPLGVDALASDETEGLDPDYLVLLRCLGHDPVAADDLMRCSGFKADVVSSMLLMLELEGYVESVPGGHYCRTGKATVALQNSRVPGKVS
jgi:DNA processing protein